TSDSSIKSWAEDAFIPAQGYYLWANSDFTDIATAPDATTTATVADDNGVALRYGPEDTGTIIDSVGWGAAENSFIEGSAFSENPVASQSAARSSATDTDVNADDFILSIPSPKNSAVSGGFISPDPVLAVTASPAADHAVISEVYPDQTGANGDFIELYNPTADAIDVSGWSVQILSGNATTTDKVEKKDFVSGNTIPSSGFFLVGVDRYAGGDMTWASGSLNSTSGATVFLVNGTSTIADFNDQRIVDRIAYGSGAGLQPEGAAAPMPASGSSLERKAVQENDCVIASGGAEYAGNACDTDNNADDFDQRVQPTPQGVANLIEPRSAPDIPQSFAVTYGTTTMQAMLVWDAVADASGATSTMSYELSSATSTNPLGALTTVTASSSASVAIREVDIPFHFSLIARDRDGLASHAATTDFTPDPIFREAYLYPDPRIASTTALELRYDAYPFLPQWPGGNGWNLVVAYLNQDPPAIPQFYSDTQYASLPGDSVTRQYGEWGTTIADALKFRYRNCSGVWSSDVTAIILPDSAGQCSSAYGGIRNKTLQWDQLEDPSVIVSLSQNQTQPGPGDYVTVATYAYAGYNTERLVAVDHRKYYFQSDVPVHQSPTAPANPDASFDASTGLLRLIWDASTDADSVDWKLQYEIAYSTTTIADSDWAPIPSAGASPDENAIIAGRPFAKIPLESGTAYTIGLRAKDDFGNTSDPLMVSFTTPDAQL
ncbi:MAG: lamin tail domain-containing protein, partial [Patescibacteria group bacterium]|nr:lamin tail domain-containing protein [Patescibacteria group bacterium]